MPALRIKDFITRIKGIPSVLAAISIDTTRVKGLGPLQNL
jgi:hypothetical protein